MIVQILQAVILGIVQGLTEFIPISSSAHLIIVPWLFGWTDPALDSLSFDVALHLGTLVALVVYFWNDWKRFVVAGVRSIAERKIGDDRDRKLAWYLVIGTIPGGIIGLLFEHKIENLFHPEGGSITTSAMVWMGIIVAALGALLFLAERLAKHLRRMDGVSLRDAIIIGCSQALAIFPGVSRSGSTITAGLAVGLERETAARFSFLLSAPIIAGAGLKSLWDIYKGIHSGAIMSSEIALFPVGFVAAAISGYFCSKYLLRFMQKNPTDIFVYYRWALAVFVIIVALVRA
jgi:undecaprenyl-diphosphatase